MSCKKNWGVLHNLVCVTCDLKPNVGRALSVIKAARVRGKSDSPAPTCEIKHKKLTHAVCLGDVQSIDSDVLTPARQVGMQVH